MTPARIVLGHPDTGAVPLPATAPRSFHAGLAGYAPTPLHDLPALAAAAGVARVLVKDETARLGLPAFKILGASWAVHRLLGADPGGLGVDRLATATDGNHGRAVARVARTLGLAATIFVPGGMRPSRREAIAAEGADVVVVDGHYDDAVRRAGREAADPACRVIADVDLEGGADVPDWVIDGYSTLFAEVAEQTPASPDLVLLQTGVGSFAAAGVRWAIERGARAVAADPAGAACIAASLAAGEPVTIDPAGTSMAGLDAATPSRPAWPTLEAGLTGVVVVTDTESDDAIRRLHALGIEAGESGAAGLAGLLALATDPTCAPLREAAGLSADSVVLTIVTEGPTDPDRHATVVDR